MATNYATVEVWVKIDEDGDYEAGPDASTAAERFEDNIGVDADKGYRMVRVTVKVPLPTPIELSGEVAADEEVGELKVA